MFFKPEVIWIVKVVTFKKRNYINFILKIKMVFYIFSFIKY